MKRLIAALLALLMVLSMAVPVLAQEEAPSGTTPAAADETEAPTDTPEPSATPEATETPAVTETPAPSETPAATEVAEPTATPEPTPADEPTGEPDSILEPLATPGDPLANGPVIPASTGQVELSVIMAMDLGGSVPSFAAELAGGEGHVYQRTVAADGEKVSFDDLPEGEYTLAVTGPGFARYEQTVAVGKSDGVLLQLSVGHVAGFDGGAHYGVLCVGDVDGDGDIDDADGEVLMRAVAGEEAGLYPDLNADGAVTLADAEYLAKSMALGQLDSALLLATEAHYVPAAAIASLPGESTQLQGMENLFKDNGESVILSSKDDRPLSEVPLEVEFSMAEGAETDAILFENTNITSGEVTVFLEDGTSATAVIGEGAAPVAMILSSAAPSVRVERDGAGNITVNLGGQKAVKRVSLKITGTADQQNLASISQVEFVNGMEDRIGEPDMSVPGNVSAVPGSRQFTVTWAPCTNITGYEVKVTAPGGEPETYTLGGTSLTVTRYANDEVLNYTTYTVCVRSVNGAWKSGWSQEASVKPVPSGKPDKPDNVTAVGAYEAITVSWKAMKDTSSYDLYYKKEGDESYTKIGELTANSYTITGLDSSKATTYEVYVVGKNEFGESAPSLHASAATVTLIPAEMPRFNLINRDTTGKPGRDHILAATQNGATMAASPLDAAGGTAWGTVDGDPASYYERRSWDDGGYNWEPGNDHGLSYEFDDVYTIDTIGMMSAVDSNMDYTYIKIRWFDAEGNSHLIGRDLMYCERRTDSQKKTYYFLRLPYPVEARKIQIGTARYWPGNTKLNVSEVYFYEYDPLKREIMGLYEDDLHTTLQQSVTLELLNDLKSQIETSVDKFGEPNPDKALLLREWETAMQIYNEQFSGRVTQVHTGITASNDDHGFGGLNAWQPLGVVAAAGESVTVYVGSNVKKSGADTSLQLVATQYNAEANAMSSVVIEKLKVGANQIEIPKIWKTTGVESGGALYVQYTGSAASEERYAVRVSGGTAVPVLDLYGIEDHGARLARVQEYLAELIAYADGQQQLHDRVHQGEGSVSKEVDYDFDERTCVLGATDIMLDTMMLSLPARQIVSGCGRSAETLLGSLDAMESMMALFYQHKGLNASAQSAADRIPNRHLNIRYQRMFSGAFMYASGDHIGIGYNETAGMAGCAGVTDDGSGRYVSGGYFGWGIAHEIGHDINQSCYAIAEITNNYFAVLAQAHDDNGSVRFDYDKVYEKVTSGTKGRAGNVFTQLGMYWQLHLAYDTGWNYATYANYDEQLKNLFFARVDTYARNPGRAPKPKGVALSLDGANVDQTLMRLACAAAQRDILDFFQRWGMTPDAGTVAYASQFDKETRAIYYVCDDSRRYTLEKGGASRLDASGATPAVGQVTVQVDPDEANKVDIAIADGGVVPADEVLGYEIVRCTISSGVAEKRTVGFTTTNDFSDVILAMNNRTVYYEITLVDKYLNRSAPVVTEPVKVRHEGNLDKTYWTVSTTGLAAEPDQTGGTEELPEIVQEDSAKRLIDGKEATEYTAQVEDNASILIELNDTQVITGFKYKAGSGTPIGGYLVDVLQAGQWVRVDEGELNGDKTVYFSNAEGRYVSTYAASAVRLSLTAQAGQTITAAELDLLGLTGDDVNFRQTEDGAAAAVGYLARDFQYGEEEDDVIPEGSLVFTGSYKGNAAYNVVVLYDQDGKIVAAHHADGSLRADQVIMAPVPATGSIKDVTDGTWIYWIYPEDLDGYVLPRQVRAELYRVNNARTNEGERLVSDSLFVTVPEHPGSIDLNGAGIGVG